MRLITMNKQTIISGHHGMYSFIPSYFCSHEISQLGGIDEIIDNYELPGPEGTKKRTVTSTKNNWIKLKDEVGMAVPKIHKQDL